MAGKVAVEGVQAGKKTVFGAVSTPVTGEYARGQAAGTGEAKRATAETERRRKATAVSERAKRRQRRRAEAAVGRVEQRLKIRPALEVRV